MKKPLVVLSLSVLLLGLGTGGGYFLGHRLGYRGGFADGQRSGERKAARDAPPPTRNKQHPLSALEQTAPWKALPPLESAEAERLAATLNEAPSPCPSQARRGISVATSLLDPKGACPSAPGAVALGLAALRSFPDDPGEALAVLRVERRVAPDISGRSVRGNPEGVVVVEYSDFQCPYCGRARPALEGLLERRSDVGLVYKNMPLSFHPAAMPAALAAEAAARQGKFWAMHDALFDLGKKITDGIDKRGTIPDSGPVPFEGLARDLGLDVERFRADVRSDEVAAVVRADRKEARSLGVNGTPTVFVGGRRVNGPLSVKALSALVDKAQAEREGRFSWDLAPAR